MTKHTPGPWASDWQFIVAPDATGLHSDIYVATIAEYDEDGRVAPAAEQAANARLIAAAPELLAALQAALPMLKGHQETPARKARYEAARAAIRRASEER